MEHKFSDYVEREIDWFVSDVTDEDDQPLYTRAEAIKEVEMRMEENGDPFERKYLKELRLYLISIGVYEVLTPKRLDGICVTSGKKYDFKIDGIFYGFKSWDALLGKECNHAEAIYP